MKKKISMVELYEATRSMSEQQWSVFHTIGNQCSLDEFADFVTNGDLPLVELSRAQLASVSGGTRKPKPVTDPHQWPK